MTLKKINLNITDQCHLNEPNLAYKCNFKSIYNGCKTSVFIYSTGTDFSNCYFALNNFF